MKKNKGPMNSRFVILSVSPQNGAWLPLFWHDDFHEAVKTFVGLKEQNQRSQHDFVLVDLLDTKKKEARK